MSTQQFISIIVQSLENVKQRRLNTQLKDKRKNVEKIKRRIICDDSKRKKKSMTSQKKKKKLNR